MTALHAMEYDCRVLENLLTMRKEIGSVGAPPRPSATKKEMEDSVSYSRNDVSYTDYMMQSVDFHAKKWQEQRPIETSCTAKSTPSPFGHPY